MSRFVGSHLGPSISSSPGTPVSSQLYYNTTTNRLYVYDGTAWQDLTLAANGGPFQGAADTLSAPTYSWSGDTDTGMYHYGADVIGFTVGGTLGMRLTTSGLIVASQRIQSVADPSSAQDVATKNYVDVLAFNNIIKPYVDNVAQGLDAKPSCRVSSTGSETYTITGGAITQISGTTVDSITLAINDRVLVKNAPASTGAGSGLTNTSSTQPANGIYVVTGNTTNLTVARALDMDNWAEVPGAYTWVDEGSNAGTGWTARGTEAGTINTSSIPWTKFAAAASNVLSRSIGTIGDGSTTTFVYTHNLNTQGVNVQVQEASSPYNVVYPDIQITSSNTITLIFAVAPTASQYQVVVLG